MKDVLDFTGICTFALGSLILFIGAILQSKEVEIVLYDKELNI